MKSKTLLIVLLALIGLDTALMVMFWELEGNPLLLGVGLYNAVALKVITALGLVWIWNHFAMHEKRVGRYSVTGLTVLYSVVVLSNVWVIA